jgi:hypothetical protein
LIWNKFLKGFGLKKVLSAFLLAILAVLVTGGFFVWERYKQNPQQVVPFPYTFEESAPATKLDAPILITGDEMGIYFSKFSTILADTISSNLAKPIRIQSLAKNGFGIHRTLHDLKGLTQWPQILIYQGASQEFFETKFHLSEITKIAKNFELYSDDRIETFLILYPELSRIVYEPIKRVTLGAEPVEDEVSETDYLKRLETEILLFEQQLVQLVQMSKDRNTLLILSTTPINLDQPPKKVCEFTTTTDIEAEILGLRDLLRANDPKSAYTKSSKLITQYSGNAELLFIHGQISKRLGNLDEAKSSLLEASAYDCNPWRATELHNSIIRKVAKQHQILLFDFAKVMEDDYGKNTTFFDETHPQNLYYDKGMEQLGLVIKSILKL